VFPSPPCQLRPFLLVCFIQHDLSRSAGGWTKRDVILELSAVLKAQDSLHLPVLRKPPTLHRLLSRMELCVLPMPVVGAVQLDEDEGALLVVAAEKIWCLIWSRGNKTKGTVVGWRVVILRSSRMFCNHPQHVASNHCVGQQN